MEFDQDYPVFRELFDKAIIFYEDHNDGKLTYDWKGPIGIGDCKFYINTFKDRFIDDNDSLTFVRELLSSNDADAIILAGNILKQIKVKDEK